MRSHYLLLLLAVPGLSPGFSLSALAAQAVPRTDGPRAGTLRVTFDPRVETWDAQFINGRRVSLGAPFSGDSSNVWFPSVTRLQRDVRAVTGLGAFVATIGRQVLAIRAERRVNPDRRRVRRYQSPVAGCGRPAGARQCGGGVPRQPARIEPGPLAAR